MRNGGRHRCPPPSRTAGTRLGEDGTGITVRNCLAPADRDPLAAQGVFGPSRRGPKNAIHHWGACRRGLGDGRQPGRPAESAVVPITGEPSLTLRLALRHVLSRVGVVTLSGTLCQITSSGMPGITTANRQVPSSKGASNAVASRPGNPALKPRSGAQRDGQGPVRGASPMRTTSFPLAGSVA
ncbi:putative protein kinase [Citreicella sp. SE45]|nr:putative protein kinase [Citreicella sp. SE45]